MNHHYGTLAGCASFATLRNFRVRGWGHVRRMCHAGSRVLLGTIDISNKITYLWGKEIFLFQHVKQAQKFLYNDDWIFHA